MPEALNLPAPCLIVLCGPGASGKSSWAEAHFPVDTIVSSDRLRALVGGSEDDLAASADAFALLEEVVRQRVGRRLTTVIDTLGLDRPRRLAWLALAKEHGLPCVAVAFDTPADECRERNRARTKRIPAGVLAGQLKAWPAVRDGLTADGFDQVLAPVALRVVPKAFAGAGSAVQRQRERPSSLRFGLHLGSYTFPGGTKETATNLRDIARAAEAAGFDAIYVMDHFRQIPQAGRAWDDFLESYTTLAYLAACTQRVDLGALVTGITYRNIGHLGKIIATLDVLSAGRAVCGLGLAWFKEEHSAYGWEFPPVARRYDLLEDALLVLPLLWGPGGPAFDGKAVSLPDTSCYPRPLQEHVPIILGGGGERRTLRLAAQYADAANVLGDAAAARRKAAVLRRHCEVLGRDPATVALSQLTTILVGESDAAVRDTVERLRPRSLDPGRFAASVNAGTVDDHVGRFRELAEAGVSEAIVRVLDLSNPAPIELMGKVIAAFRP